MSTPIRGWHVAVVAAGLSLTALMLLAQPDHPRQRRSPYQTCLAAASTPGDSGYATEVCEPLSPGYREPASVLTADMIHSGPVEWATGDAVVSVPDLATDVADRCSGDVDLHDCVAAIVKERREHR